MATLPPSNVGLIGAFHEEMRGRSSPSARGSRQYRERSDHRLFHNGGKRRARAKAPALSVFSPVNTKIGVAFSTGVEDVGDEPKLPGNRLFFVLRDGSRKSVE
jgi:hypothetical protein